jgi:hypothetical protein
LGGITVDVRIILKLILKELCVGINRTSIKGVLHEVVR